MTSDEQLTSSDKIQTISDEEMTNSDRIQTGSDEQLTSSDSSQTMSDRQVTSSDRIYTTSDKQLTSSDKWLTGSGKWPGFLDKSNWFVFSGLWEFEGVTFWLNNSPPHPLTPSPKERGNTS